MWLLLAWVAGCLVNPDDWESRRRQLRCDASATDRDRDGFVAASDDRACTPPGPVDCDDGNANVHPGARELIADGLDSDCDGKERCHLDDDGDGYGGVDVVDGPAADLRCASPGLSSLPLDCDDGDAGVGPGRPEVLCNEADDDCDPETPDGIEEVPADGVDQDCDGGDLCFQDLDGDGYGTAVLARSSDLSCAFFELLADQAGDCDDGQKDVFPGSPEVCNLVDDDCNDLVDEADPGLLPSELMSVVADRDGDGFGHPTDSVEGCFGPPDGNRLDCDDQDPLATIDQAWFADLDGDGAGAGAVLAQSCLPPGGGLVPAAAGVDCRPFDAEVLPGLPEDCTDGRDQDCDGDVDCLDADCAAHATCVGPCVQKLWAPGSIPAQTGGSTLVAGTDAFQGSCNNNNGNDFALWFVPPVSGQLSFNLSGTSWDTILFALDGCEGAELACNDDEPVRNLLWSTVSLDVTAGEPIVLVVDGYAPSELGAFHIEVNEP